MIQHSACRVVDLVDATYDIRIVRLAMEDAPLRFHAGQYARLGFSSYPRRDYSMANRPDEPILEFHIRDMGEGPSRYAVRTLRSNELVDLEGPFGTAYLRPEHRGPILAVAGGSGLAPIKSIVETALNDDRERQIMLYFGARTERDLYFLDRFAALGRRHANLRFVPVVSEPTVPTPHRTGLIADAIATDLSSLIGLKAYLAGPPALVQDVAEKLQARGLAQDDIHADPFVSEAEKLARSGV
jgi:CDP-4-dehydro-6-deoxyglucose reductase/ferredoxin-NAD(P)+ reductase (naphthalene dioxygenase ferredoxin-specific)